MNILTNNTLVEVFQAIISSTTLIVLISGSGAFVLLAVVLFFVIRCIVKRKRKKREILAVIKRLVGQTVDIYYLIDIRENDSYIKKHIPTAINIPYKEIDQFFPTETMFTRIFVCGDNLSKVKKVAQGLRDRAYFRVDILPHLSKWDGEWETGAGREITDIEEVRKDEVQ